MLHNYSSFMVNIHKHILIIPLTPYLTESYEEDLIIRVLVEDGKVKVPCSSTCNPILVGL